MSRKARRAVARKRRAEKGGSCLVPPQVDRGTRTDDTFVTLLKDVTQEILFQPDDSNTLEIAIASSMVKELSPLVLYLRYLVLPDELLIIDEPEMNLHPEAQAKITEFLAMLVNAGINVLVTTHSPDVVDHLANLLKAAEKTDEEKEAVRDEFYLQRTDAFITKDKVSVYLIDDGSAKNALDEDGVIQWNTFGDVSDRISEIYFKL